MSQYGREFRLEWKTAFNEFSVRVSIYETDNLIGDGDTPEVISLTPSGNPLILSTIDNDRNKFSTVRSKQAKISFLTGDYDINTFFDSPDDKWYCVITLTDSGVTLFKGFISIADISQPFLPDPVEVILTATDKLGALKEVPLLTYNDLVPSGKVLFSIWYSAAFLRTGLDLPLKVQWNIRELDSNDFHFFWKNYIDALTFENEIGEIINAYEVLNRLSKGTAFCTQYKGDWWIKRIDEFDFTTLDWVASFDSLGNYESIDSGTTYLYNIGALSNAKWIKTDQLLSSDRPHKEIKLKYEYDYPQEIPCNVNFERGDLIDGSDPLNKTYELDCWDNILFNKTTGAETAETSATTYINRIFNDQGDEEERYVVFTGGAYSVTNYHAIKSQKIEVGDKDKFNINFSWRVPQSLGVLEYYPCLIKFAGHSGTNYYWSFGVAGSIFDGFDYRWRTSPANFRSAAIQTDIDLDDYENDWQNVSIECDAVPESGDVYIYLYNYVELLNQPGSHFTDLEFEYKPYIAGSYLRYNAQQNKLSRSTTGYYPSKEETVFVSDAPRPLIKGAIFKFDNDLSRYVLIDECYDHTESPLAVPSTDSGKLVSYGKLQAIDFWNQYKTGFRILEGTAIGLDDDNPPDVIHRYVFTNTDPNINGKTFMCVGFEQNWKTEQWRGDFAEVYRNSIGRTYTDDHEKKFLVNG